MPRPVPLSQALAQGMTAAQIDALNLPTDKGAMFLLALAIAALAGISIFIERSNLFARTHPASKPERASFA